MVSTAANGRSNGFEAAKSANGGEHANQGKHVHSFFRPGLDTVCCNKIA